MGKHIYVDFDGVIANFAFLVLDHFGMSRSLYRNIKSWDAFDHMIGKNWVDIFLMSPEFHARIEKTKEADSILHTLKLIPMNKTLVTARLSWGAMKAAQMFYKRHNLNIYGIQDVAFIRNKGDFAAPNKLLIDDREDNVISFIQSGGKAVLVGRPWNSATYEGVPPGSIIEAANGLRSFLEE